MQYDQKRRKSKPLKRVTVTLEGGVIQHVQVPKGIIVEVKDFDTEGVEAGEFKKLPKNKQGEAYIRSTWTHEG